ncbi:RDD family protein [Herbivorax sp. ANBcel31]|uniref:RDD family protein n=1 Tax=Herbivorax sp. ANBcel31 TaxID=3069754 RepID=UPI0027AE3477|nr:RDD family protein [Herbivorax sp. ANBcel31]MDQ2085955.1 RDD family protein [Herbivorax sp. ANBcel31]
MEVSKLSRRFWAYFFDIIIVTGVYTGIVTVLHMLGRDIPIKGFLERDVNDVALVYLTIGLVYLFYEIVFLSSKFSSTPGKLILNLEVVSCKKSSVFDALIRSSIKVLATLTQIVPVVFFIISIFTKNKQAVHDIASDTIVMQKKKRKVVRSNNVNPNVNLFEEMKRRGLRTYSEQVALAKELNCYRGGKPANSSSYAWLGVLIFVFSIACGIFFISFFYPDIKSITSVVSM